MCSDNRSRRVDIVQGGRCCAVQYDQLHQVIARSGILDGNEHQLASLVNEKPTLLLMGSYSCPVYRRILPEIVSLSSEAFQGNQSYGDLVNFVHVYVVEAHPQSPAPAPHFGLVSEEEFSDVPQAFNYERRRTNAELLSPVIPDDHLLLIDDLRPRGVDNPVWSSYGSGAASAWLIRTDGRIIASHDWIDMRTLKKSLRLMLMQEQS